jgi:rhodanese-related sulfurtransferase
MMRRMVLALGAALLMGTPAARAQAPMEIAGATTVDAAGIVRLVGEAPDVVILDNRRAEDFAAGYIEGAIRVLDTDLDEAVMARHAPSRATPVLFYCNGLACGRAANAARKAVGWGYTRVYYYALGMEEWRRLGMPLAGP